MVSNAGTEMQDRLGDWTISCWELTSTTIYTRLEKKTFANRTLLYKHIIVTS